MCRTKPYRPKRLRGEPLEGRCLLSVYSVTQMTDAQGNLEYQLFAGGFQFGTVLQTPQGGVGFRGHPDQSDINGWGSTAWENVYVAGPESGAIDGQVVSAVVESDGIEIAAQGSVPSGNGTVGTWNWNTVITYNAASQDVALNGETTVALASALTGDMNLGSISSNYLYDYPLNGGGVVNTGDMKSVSYAYGPDSYVRQGQWTPVPGMTGTSPTDASDDLALTVWGQLNQSDPNLTLVSKPTVERELISSDPTTKMIVACNWASTEVGYWYDTAFRPPRRTRAATRPSAPPRSACPCPATPTWTAGSISTT